MSITISVRSSATGKPQPKPGMAGALGVTEPEGSVDNEVSIAIDEGHDIERLPWVLDALGRTAATAFGVTFPAQGVIEFVNEAADPDDEKIEDPHICGPDCGVGVGVVELPQDATVGDFMEKLRETIARSRKLRGVDTEIRSDEDQVGYPAHRGAVLFDPSFDGGFEIHGELSHAGVSNFIENQAAGA